MAPPPSVTVTSSAGGSATVTLAGSGTPFLPGAPVASAVAEPTAVQGATVRLDGTGSTGETDTYSWTQTAGPPVSLTDATSPMASFIAGAPGAYVFNLTVAGPGGTGVPMTVTVNVINVVAPRADAGVDQTVVRGRAVALDGSRSTAVETYSWRQVSGPAVTLTGATSARPAFTYPTQALPAAPGPNGTFVYDNSPVVLELTVRNPGGISTSRVTVRPQADPLGGITARYRTGKLEWRIDGSSTLLAGQRVTVVLGSSLSGTVIGTGAVDATGAFSVRVDGANPGNLRTISMVSSAGGRVLGAAVTVTN